MECIALQNKYFSVLEDRIDMASKKINSVIDGFRNQPDEKAVNALEDSLREIMENLNN